MSQRLRFNFMQNRPSSRTKHRPHLLPNQPIILGFNIYFLDHHSVQTNANHKIDLPNQRYWLSMTNRWEDGKRTGSLLSQIYIDFFFLGNELDIFDEIFSLKTQKKIKEKPEPWHQLSLECSLFGVRYRLETEWGAHPKFVDD